MKLICLFVLWLGLHCAAQAQEQSQQEQRVLRGFVPYQKQQYAQAAKHFLTAAKAGVRAAQYNYGVMILRGEIRKAQSPTDLQEAVSWIRKSAAQGFPEAQYALGKLYDDGELVGQDRPVALTWFEKAGEQKNVDALLELITAHMIGRATPQNYSRAAAYAETAAQLNDGGAQYLLASFYEHGTGVEQDLAKALTWYGRAARNGDPSADFKAREMAKKLRDQNTPEPAPQSSPQAPSLPHTPPTPKPLPPVVS